MRLFTSRYACPGLNNKDHVPVCISLGLPKFPISYEVELFRLLAPQRSLWGLPPEEFKQKYMANLDLIGVEKIKADLEKIQAGQHNKDKPLVLLCFENVWKGQRCHRRYFAEWWEAMTGQEVPELPEPQAGKKEAQGGLFTAVV